MNKIFSKSILVFIGLFFAIAATRYHHFGSITHLPDASLAVFFLAGFLLRQKIVFPILLVQAGVIDYFAITAGGSSDWCVTSAYWFLIPAYGSLWLAGRWYASVHRTEWKTILLLFGALFIGASLAFLISNGSFYWLSGRYPDPIWSQYIERFVMYYPSYLSSAFLYVGFFVVLMLGIHALKSINKSKPATGG